MTTALTQCPYEVLEISREATIEEIKKSYKRLAIIHHPDKNQGKAEATEMFQRIGAAYGILSCPEKRERYDRTGSLDENEADEFTMDDVMAMFMQSFGGGDMMFGGGPIMFEFSTGSGSRSRKGRHQEADLFNSIFSQFVVDDDSDEGDDFGFFMEGGDNDEFENQIAQVIPGLFCEYFMDEVGSVTSAKSKKSSSLSNQFKCSICSTTVHTPEQAEFHYIEKHRWLMARFVDLLAGSDASSVEVVDLFEEFATAVKTGQIKEPSGRPKSKRRPLRVRKPKRRY